MKSLILSLSVGSLVVVDGSLAEVTSSKGCRGCKGDTVVACRRMDGTEVSTGWRNPAVKELRIAGLADCAAAFGVELPAVVAVEPEVVVAEGAGAPEAEITGGVDAVCSTPDETPAAETEVAPAVVEA